jgi:hypothetical protein
VGTRPQEFAGAAAVQPPRFVRAAAEDAVDRGIPILAVTGDDRPSEPPRRAALRRVLVTTASNR